MITKTLNLGDEYQDLFAEIFKASSTTGSPVPPIDINDMADYFQEISKIKLLEGGKFVRLPLDEPLFEIDANTRKINIPVDFKSNGVAVQGDHLAEIVYFSIDRYFDYTDLSSCDICINWKMGALTGKTKLFGINLNAMPGYIIFGWPIDEIVTEKSGTLMFAVEFTKPDHAYAFNTLAATVNIKEGLIIKDVEVRDLTDNILGILTDSQYGEGEAAVGDVQWTLGLVLGVGEDNNVILLPAAEVVSFPTVIGDNGPESVAANLYAQAVVEGGEVQYMDSTAVNILPIAFTQIARLLRYDGERVVDVTYYDSNGQVVDPPEEGQEDPQLFVEVPLMDNLTYYILDGNNAFVPASAEALADLTTPLFLKLAKLPINEAGLHSIKAQGYKMKDGKRIGVGRVSDSNVIQVPEVASPSEIKIEKVGFDFDNAEGYSLNSDQATNYVFLGNEGAQLHAEAEVDYFGALQFIWKKDNVAIDADPAFLLTNDSILNINAPGVYEVSVINFLNSKTATPTNSAKITASAVASKILSAEAYQAVGDELQELPETRIVTFNSKSAALSDRSLTLAIDTENIVRDGDNGVLSYAWKRGDNFIGEDSSIIVRSEGYYTPVIKNTYNGSVYTFELDNIFVDDLANNE